MCVLIVPDELKELQLKNEREQKLRQTVDYSQQFEQYWQTQAKDTSCIVGEELERDQSFLEMVKKGH